MDAGDLTNLQTLGFLMGIWWRYQFFDGEIVGFGETPGRASQLRFLGGNNEAFENFDRRGGF